MGKESSVTCEEVIFFRLPKILFTEERFRCISTSGKLLYGMLLDRVSLSAKNGWVDEKKRVYVYYTVSTVQEMLGCSANKALKLLAELEMMGLIEKKRQGQGKPAVILVKNLKIQEEDEIGYDRNYSSD